MTTVRERFLTWWNERESIYLAEMEDSIHIADIDGQLMLVGAMGFPVSYDHVMLLRDIIDDSYSDMDEESVCKIMRDMLDGEYRKKDKSATRIKPSPKAGYIYVISAGGKYKIGRTGGDVKKRIASIQNSIPWKISIVGTIKTDDMIELERHLHELFAPKRTAGEWFNLDTDDLDHIQSLEY